MTLCLPLEMSLSKEVLWAYSLSSETTLMTGNQGGRAVCQADSPRERLPISGAQDHPGDAGTVCACGRWAFSNDPPPHAEEQQIDPYDLYCTLLVAGHSKLVCGGPAFSKSPTTVPRVSAGTVHTTNQNANYCYYHLLLWMFWTTI